MPAASHNAGHDPAEISPTNAASTLEFSECEAAFIDDETGDLLENDDSQDIEVDPEEADGAAELSASSDYSLVDEDGGGSATQASQIWISDVFPPNYVLE